MVHHQVAWRRVRSPLAAIPRATPAYFLLALCVGWRDFCGHFRGLAFVEPAAPRPSTRCNSLALAALPNTQADLLTKAKAYEAMEIQPDDMEGLDELRQLVASHTNDPKWARVNDDMVKRHLLGRKMDASAAYERLQELVDWQANMFPIDPAFIESEARTGTVLMHGEDKLHHPVLYTICRNHDRRKRDIERCVANVVATLEEGIRRLPPGMGKFLLVFDARGIGMAQADFAIIREAIYLLERRYPVRAFKLYAVGLPRIFNFMWTFAKKFLDPLSASKVEFLENFDMLTKYIDLEQMPDIVRNEVEEMRNEA